MQHQTGDFFIESDVVLRGNSKHFYYLVSKLKKLWNVC